MVIDLHAFVCTVMHATSSMHAIIHDLNTLPLQQSATFMLIKMLYSFERNGKCGQTCLLSIDHGKQAVSICKPECMILNVLQ